MAQPPTRRLILSASALLLFGTFFGLSIKRLVSKAPHDLYFSKVPIGHTGSDGSNVIEASAFVLVVTGFVTAVLVWEVCNAWRDYKTTKKRR
jgi:hypothetical protein